MNQNKEITLAYSGGLDTSFCIPYLLEQGYIVHTVCINTGGFSPEELNDMKARAHELGATKYTCINVEEEYFEKCIKYLIFGNILKNNTYPLSVSSERPFQALALLDYCLENNITAFAHGSTGAGNDQIRFDIIFKTLAPEIEIITPIRDNQLSRQAELDYLAERGFAWEAVQKTYSVNQGIWGTSVGGKETLTSHLPLPEEAYPRQKSLSNSEELSVHFEKGIPTQLNGMHYNNPINLIKKLTEITDAYGIGRDIHVGDTIIGIKGRVGFAAGAPLVLIKAHELLEKHTLTKWQIHWKKQLADWYGAELHEGKYLEPLLRNIENFLTDSQEKVTGTVFLKLHPYRFTLSGIESTNDLMQAKFGSYGEENKAWTGQDAKGFTNIMSNAAKIYYSVHSSEKPVKEIV